MRFATSNPIDKLIISSDYPTGNSLPFVVGTMGSGIVVASGGGSGADELVGSKVGLITFAGCWSEYAVADVWGCIVLRDDIPFELGCFI